ncbi:hypothetical protein BGZ52_002443 [Haplosporangium bisporale]|nr:hypothetical protein BGZ52_002443 [Haplosporangium bisporale]
MQKLLLEKENTLRVAEDRAAELQQVAVGTETLTREIHDLEITIRDLRTNLQFKEKALKESQHQLTQDRHQGQEQQKLLESEISKLHAHLHDKEAVQKHLKELQNDLDEANKQKARLMVHIREISAALKDREASLKSAHSNVQNLEKSNTAHSKDVSRLSGELNALKKGLADREHQLKDCHRKIKSLEGAQEKVHSLGLQLQNLRDQLFERNAIVHDLEKDNKTLTKDSNKADKLTEEVRVMREDIKDRETLLKKALEDVKDLLEYRELANNLEDELKDLRDQVNVQEKHLTYLEDALEAHENCAVEAQQLQDQIDSYELLIHEKETKIDGLQKANKGLQKKDTRIEALEGEIETLRLDIHIKEHDAAKLKEKADHDISKISSTASTLRVELKKQVKDAEDEARHNRQLQQDKINDLTAELQDWENHEAKWIDQTNELTQELEKGIALVRQKEKRFHDVKYKLTEKDAEIGRLNDAVIYARSELSFNRKRRASEIEEQVAEKTHHFHEDKHQLEGEIADLEGQIVHLGKRIRLNHDHVVKEQELGQKISELNVWKQNAIQQAKEWETTASNFEHVREKQESTISGFEREVTMLQTQLENADAWRLKAIAQAEQLTAMISKLETELSMIKAVLAQHDANDASLNETVHTMNVTIETLQTTKDELQDDLATRNADILRLQGLLKEEGDFFKAKLAVIRKDLAVKEKKIESLHSRISDYTRSNTDLESTVNKGKDLLAQLESSNDRLKGSLGAQMERYKALDNKYQATLIVQADQDKQLYRLEKNLERVTAEDADKLAQARSRIRHLEKELEKDNEKIDEMQVHVHNVTRKYHNTLAKLENATARMASMVPAAESNHDTCAARIQDGERTISELDGRIDDLEKTIVHMTKKMDTQSGQWSAAEVGYKDRIRKLTSSQNALETRLHAAEHEYNQERLGRDQDHLRADREGEKKDAQIQGLRRSNKQLQQEFAAMETRMRKEMSTTKDLMDSLHKLRNNIKRGSEAELHSLNELEKEIKSRSSVAVETIQTVRSRMDSGAFMESNETGNMTTSSSLTGQRHVAAH